MMTLTSYQVVCNLPIAAMCCGSDDHLPLGLKLIVVSLPSVRSPYLP